MASPGIQLCLAEVAAPPPEVLRAIQAEVKRLAQSPQSDFKCLKICVAEEKHVKNTQITDQEPGPCGSADDPGSSNEPSKSFMITFESNDNGKSGTFTPQVQTHGNQKDDVVELSDEEDEDSVQIIEEDILSGVKGNSADQKLQILSMIHEATARNTLCMDVEDAPDAVEHILEQVSSDTILPKPPDLLPSEAKSCTKSDDLQIRTSPRKKKQPRNKNQSVKCKTKSKATKHHLNESDKDASQHKVIKDCDISTDKASDLIPENRRSFRKRRLTRKAAIICSDTQNGKSETTDEMNNMELRLKKNIKTEVSDDAELSEDPDLDQMFSRESVSDHSSNSESFEAPKSKRKRKTLKQTKPKKVLATTAKIGKKKTNLIKKSIKHQQQSEDDKTSDNAHLDIAQDTCSDKKEKILAAETKIVSKKGKRSQKKPNLIRKKTAETLNTDDNDLGDRYPKKSKSGTRKRKRKENIFECDKCYKSFKQDVYFKNHSCTGKKFQCEQCGQQYSKRESLRKHLNVHAFPAEEQKDSPKKSIPSTCEKCGKVLSSLRALAQHQKIHASEKKFVCARCDKSFIQKGNLKTHITTIHEGRRPYLCTLCGRSFTQKSGLDYHTRTHEDQERFQNIAGNSLKERIILKCILCHYRFPRMLRYLYHLKQHLANDPDLEEEEIEKAKKILKEHDEVLKTSRMFSCNVCGKPFFHRSDFSNHMKTHETGKPAFQCKYCGKGLCSYSSMRFHERTYHKDELEPCSFSCSICNKGFSDENRLQKHCSVAHLRNFHHPQKEAIKRLFICKTCGKSLSSFYNLTVHTRTHTNDRPFKCPVCKATFSDPANMIHHGKRKHSGYPKHVFETSKDRPEYNERISGIVKREQKEKYTNVEEAQDVHVIATAIENVNQASDSVNIMKADQTSSAEMGTTVVLQTAELVTDNIDDSSYIEITDSIAIGLTLGQVEVQFCDANQE